MVVTYNWAQYAIAAFKQNPNVTGEGHISFDGRFRTCYPQQIVDMHFDFICGDGGPDKRFRGPDSPPYDGSRILEFKKPSLVIISRRQEHSTYMMSQNTANWSLLYQDELTQVWGRKSVFDDRNTIIHPHEEQDATNGAGGLIRVLSADLMLHSNFVIILLVFLFGSWMTFLLLKKRILVFPRHPEKIRPKLRIMTHFF